MASSGVGMPLDAKEARKLELQFCVPKPELGNERDSLLGIIISSHKGAKGVENLFAPSPETFPLLSSKSALNRKSSMSRILIQKKRSLFSILFYAQGR